MMKITLTPATGNLKSVAAMMPDPLAGIKPAEINQFEQLMNHPIDSVADVAESILLGYQTYLDQVPAKESFGTDPMATFEAMQSVMRATTTIEITAKLAGSLTQSINRLVAIQ